MQFNHLVLGLLSTALLSQTAPPAPPARPAPSVQHHAVRPGFRYGPGFGYGWGFGNTWGNILGASVGSALVFGGVNILGTYIYNKQLRQEARENAIWGTPSSQGYSPNDELRWRESAPEPPPPPGEPLARFDSEPSGADVLIDGRFVGTTPTQELRVAPGAHRITISRTGYQPWSGELRGVPGNTDSFLQRLEVASDPTKPRISGM